LKGIGTGCIWEIWEWRNGNQRRRGLKSWEAGSCDFPTEEIMGARNFNFAPKFPQSEKFPAKILYFCKKIFRQEDFPKC